MAWAHCKPEGMSTYADCACPPMPFSSHSPPQDSTPQAESSAICWCINHPHVVLSTALAATSSVPSWTYPPGAVCKTYCWCCFPGSHVAASVNCGEANHSVTLGHR